MAPRQYSLTFFVLLLTCCSCSIAWLPAGRAQPEKSATVGGIRFQKQLGDMVPVDMLPANESVPALTVAVRLIGEDAWPVSQALYDAVNRTVAQIHYNMGAECNVTFMPTPTGITQGLGLQEAEQLAGGPQASSSILTFIYRDPPCLEECTHQLLPGVSAEACRQCGLQHPFSQAHCGSVDLMMRVAYTRRSVLVGSTQGRLGQMIEGSTNAAGLKVRAFAMAYRLLPEVAKLAAYSPIDPMALQFEAHESVLRITAQGIVPFSTEKENRLMLMWDKYRGERVAYFRPSKVLIDNKAHSATITYIVNRMWYAHTGDFREVWTAHTDKLAADLVADGLTDAEVKLIKVKDLTNETLGDQLKWLAKQAIEGNPENWPTGPPWWPTIVVLLALAFGYLLVHSEDRGMYLKAGSSSLSLPPTTPQASHSPTKASIARFQRTADGKHAAKNIPLHMGDQTSYADIEICQRTDGSDWLLGAGASAKVYKGSRNGVQDVAVKVLHLADEAQLRAFEKEINLMRTVSNDKNIVQFYGAFLQKEQTMMLTEYMEGGDLMNAIATDTKRELRWARKGNLLALDVAKGLVHLHSHNVIHMDLKSKNILLNKEKNLAKITDVGLSRVVNSICGVSRGGKRHSTEPTFQLGTFEYTAPEVFLGRPCNEKIDIYALGVVLWEICTHEMPVRGRMREIRVPEECPREIFDLINACLAESPDGRPSAKEVHRSIKMWRHKWMLAIRQKYDSPPQLERRSSADSTRRSSDSADGSILMSSTSSEMRSGPRRSSSLGNSGEHLMTAQATHSGNHGNHDHTRPDEIADASIDGEDRILYRSGESVQSEVEESLLQRPDPIDWKKGGDDAMDTIREEQSAAGIPKDSQASMFAQMAAQMKPFDDESSEGSDHVSEDKTPTHDSANSTVAHAIDIMDDNQTRHKLSGDKGSS